MKKSAPWLRGKTLSSYGKGTELLQEPNEVNVIVENIEAKCYSPFEVKVLRMIVVKGFKVQPQVKVGPYHSDLVIEEIRDCLAIEFDSERWHGLEKWDEDMQRQYNLGISNEQICVLVAQDRNGQVISQMAGKGRIKSIDIDRVIGAYIDSSSLLCSDTTTNYKKFAKDKGLQHETVNVRKGIYVKQTIYHIQHVNAYYKRLKKFMERFQGVATKYLDNYLYWFRYLEQSKKVNHKERVKELFLSACHKSNYNTVEMFRSA